MAPETLKRMTFGIYTGSIYLYHTAERAEKVMRETEAEKPVFKLSPQEEQLIAVLDAAQGEDGEAYLHGVGKRVSRDTYVRYVFFGQGELK